MAMQIPHSIQNLADIETAFVIGDNRTTFMQFHHRSLFAQFQNYVNVGGIVEEAEKSHDIGMLERFVDLNFLGHFLLLVVLGHQFLGDDFAGINTAATNVFDFVAFGEATLISFFFIFGKF